MIDNNVSNNNNLNDDTTNNDDNDNDATGSARVCSESTNSFMITFCQTPVGPSTSVFGRALHQRQTNIWGKRPGFRDWAVASPLIVLLWFGEHCMLQNPLAMF